MPPRSHPPIAKPSEHSILLNLARRALIFLAPDGQPYATIPLSGNTVPLYSQLFRDWLSLVFEEHGYLPGSAQYAAILRKLDEDAQCFLAPFTVHLRTAHQGDRTYCIDLDNNRNEAIEVTSKQWTTTYNDACRFNRPESALPLPTPEPVKAKIHHFLMRLFRIEKADALALSTWLVSALLPDLKPPMLVITGSESDEAVRKLRTIIDPVRCPINVLPRSEAQLGIKALTNRIPTFSLGPTLSESCKHNLNKLRTGLTVQLKKANSSRPATETTVHRPILIAAPKAHQIHEGQINVVINYTCDTDHAQILGALLDAVVAGIREMTRQPQREYFAAPDMQPFVGPPPPEPPPPFT